MAAHCAACCFWPQWLHACRPVLWAVDPHRTPVACNGHHAACHTRRARPRLDQFKMRDNSTPTSSSMQQSSQLVMSAFGPPRACLHVCNLQPTPSECPAVAAAAARAYGGGHVVSGGRGSEPNRSPGGHYSESSPRLDPCTRACSVCATFMGVHLCARAPAHARVHARSRDCTRTLVFAFATGQPRPNPTPLGGRTSHTPANRSQLHWSAQCAACVATPPGSL